jgi:hypothetical protein
MVKTTTMQDQDMLGDQVVDENNKVVVLSKPRCKGTCKSQKHKGSSNVR